MRDHRVPEPVFFFFRDEIGEQARQIGDCHADGRKSAAVFRDRSNLPVGTENVSCVPEVLLKKWMMRPDVTDARPSLQFAAAQDGRVLAGTAVIPAPRAAYLTSALHEL